MNGTPVISDTIRQLCNAGLTTQVELAELAHVGESTLSRWSADIGGPDFTHVCRWIGHHPKLAVRRAFRRCVPIIDTPAEADINGDGDADYRDVIAGSTELVSDTALLNNTIHAATQDGEISETEATEICRVADGLIQMGRALMTAADCSAVRRRKAVQA